MSRIIASRLAAFLRGRIPQLLGPFNGRRLLPGAEGASENGTGTTLVPKTPFLQEIVAFV
jgi:hypothetical protein